MAIHGGEHGGEHEGGETLRRALIDIDRWIVVAASNTRVRAAKPAQPVPAALRTWMGRSRVPEAIILGRQMFGDLRRGERESSRLRLGPIRFFLPLFYARFSQGASTSLIFLPINLLSMLNEFIICPAISNNSEKKWRLCSLYDRPCELLRYEKCQQNGPKPARERGMIVYIRSMREAECCYGIACQDPTTGDLVVSFRPVS